MSEQTRAVHLPPRSLSDLILHYRDVDFHVHKLVLYQQCEYFRADPPSLHKEQQQQQRQDAASAPAAQSEAAQQLSSSASPGSSSLSSVAGEQRDSSSARSQQKRARSLEPLGLQPFPAAPAVERDCRHPPLIACLRLPHRVGVVAAGSATLQLFLTHLYFPCMYPLPPFAPLTRVDLSTIEQDDTALPLFPTPDAAATVRYCERDPQGYSLFSPGLLSLIHYFHAERLWQQSLAVIRSDCSEPRSAWPWLSVMFSSA